MRPNGAHGPTLPPRFRRSVAAVLLLAATAACGSTVANVGREDGQQAGSGLPELSTPTGRATAPTFVSQQAGAAGVGGGAQAGTTGSGPAGSSPAGAATAGSAVKIPGLTSTTIAIGYGTEKDADQSAPSFGLTNVAFGDQEAQANAVAADINRHGGLLGRKIVMVFHDDKTANDTANPDQTAAAQCADWTQDRPVFAALNIVGARNVPSFYACMAKAHTPLLVNDLVEHTLSDFKEFQPYLYAPGTATLDRWVPVWFRRLNALQYFTPWDTTAGGPGAAPVKVGILYTDDSGGRHYLAAVKSALAAVGRNIDATFAFSTDTATAIRQIPEALLRFRSDGITHIPLDGSLYLFTPLAEQQHYRPRWGVTSLDELATLTTSTSPTSQLTGALGIGWVPASDVDAGHDPGNLSPNQARCTRIMSSAGLAPSSRLALTVQLINCDLFFFLEAALQHAGALSAVALQEGAAALGNKLGSPYTFHEQYGPGRYDGANAARDIAWDSGCGCFAYASGIDRLFS